jgi:hypothetical protein
MRLCMHVARSDVRISRQHFQVPVAADQLHVGNAEAGREQPGYRFVSQIVKM